MSWVEHERLGAEEEERNLGLGQLPLPCAFLDQPFVCGTSLSSIQQKHTAACQNTVSKLEDVCVLFLLLLLLLLLWG